MGVQAVEDQRRLPVAARRLLQIGAELLLDLIVESAGLRSRNSGLCTGYRLRSAEHIEQQRPELLLILKKV